MTNPLLTNEFEDRIIALVDRKDDLSRNELKIKAKEIVNEITINGYRLIADLNKENAAGILGSLGGRSTSDKYGKDHYRKLAEHMNRKRREKKQRSEAH